MIMRYTKELYFLFLLLQSCNAQKNSKVNGKDGKKENKNGKMNLNPSQVKSTTVISSYIPTHLPTVVPSIATPPCRFPSINPSRVPSNSPTVASDSETSTTAAVMISMQPTISPSKTPTMAPKTSYPILQPTISPSNIPTIKPNTSNPTSIGPSMAPTATERTQLSSHQNFPLESPVTAQFFSLTPSELRSEPIHPHVTKVNESQQISTERTSSPSTVVYQTASPSLTSQNSSSDSDVRPSAAARPVLPTTNTRPVVARLPSIQSPSKRIQSPFKKSMILPKSLVEKDHRKPILSYSSTSSTVHRIRKSPNVSPSPSSSLTTLHISSSTHYPEHKPALPSLSPKQFPSMTSNPSSSMSPSPSSSMSPSPSSSMSPSPSSSISPSPSSSMSPSPSTLPIYANKGYEKNTTKDISNHETTNINQYIIINLYLTSMTEEQRREERQKRWTRAERHSSQDTSYCQSQYKELTGYISAGNVRMYSTFDSIIAVIANIIKEATNNQVEGVNILRSHSNSSNGYIKNNHGRNLLSQFLALDLSNPLLIVEDRNCWVHMRVPLGFTSTQDDFLDNSTSSKNGGKYSNQTSPIPYGSMQHIRVKALRALEKSAIDGSFIERLHLNELVIRNLSFDLHEDSRFINSEQKSKSSTEFWEPIRLTGIALFFSTFLLTVVLITVARNRSQQEESQRISSQPVIIESQS